jgi:predicted enzyme related to lactoylglutathione lyase
MFHGVSHVVVPVRDLARARRFYVGTLGGVPAGEGPGWADVDGGGCKLRLTLTLTAGVDGRPAVTLKVQAPDIAAAVAAAVAGGAETVAGPTRTEDLQLVAEVRDPEGNRLVIWRDLTEDEYGFTPELPATLTWAPEARDVLNRLLGSVPWPFRPRARTKSTAEAEALAAASPTRTVDPVTAVRGFIRAAPRPMRGFTRGPVEAAGFDPDDFVDDYAE